MSSPEAKTDGSPDNYVRQREPSPKDLLRQRLCDILGADRWIPGMFPTVAPVSTTEVSRLLKGYSGSVMVVGSGLSFPSDFNPGRDTLIILMNNLKEHLEISKADQTLTVSAGCDIGNVKTELNKSGIFVGSLDCLKGGTIGGRLASVSSRPTLSRPCGWVQDLLGVLVVLPSGDAVKLGGRCIKDVAGYDLRHLFTGSRGSAGVITGAVFRCKPLSVKVVSNVPFDTEQQNLLAPNGTFGTTQLPVSSYDALWRKVFDPFSRMKPGF